MQFSIPPGTHAPVGPDVNDALTRVREALRTEMAPARQALLLQEQASLQEATGDDHRAAAELLAAVNADPSQLEPLEHLLAVLQRRHSKRNVARLLERFAQVSRTPAELQRADHMATEIAADLLDDLETALAAAQQAAARSPDQLGLWLTLAFQSPASADGDELRLQALAERIRLATRHDLRTHLHLLQSEVASRTGQHELATDWLLSGHAERGAVESQVGRRLERLAQRHRDSRLLAIALRTQLEAEGGTHHSEADDDVLPRALLLSRFEADELRLPTNSPATSGYRRDIVHLLTDPDGALSRTDLSDLLRPIPQLLACLADPGRPLPTVHAPWVLGPALDMARAELGTSADELARAARAWSHYLAHTPGSGDLERRWASAYALWAGLLRAPAEGSIRELSAQLEGLSMYERARAGRLLGARYGERDWIFECGEALLSHVDKTEARGLLFEQAQRAALAGDARGYRFALEELRETLPTVSDEPALREALFGSLLLSAYAPASVNEEAERPRLDALHQLRDLLPQGGKRIAFEHALLRASGTLDRDALLRILSDNPSYAEAAFELLGQASPVEPERVCEWLATAANAESDEPLQAALLTLAAVLAYRGKQLTRGEQLLRRRPESSDSGVNLLLTWGRELMLEPSPQRELAVLALSEGRPRTALEQLRRATAHLALDQRELLLAALTSETPRGAGSDALQLLLNLVDEEAGEEAAPAQQTLLADLQRARVALAPSPVGAHDPSRSARAADWARGSRRGSAALHWVSTAASAMSDDEISAREHLASLLPDGAAAAVNASAQLVALIHGKTPRPLPGTYAASVLVNLEQNPPLSPAPERAAALEAAAPLFGKESARLRLLAAFKRLSAGEYRPAFAAFKELAGEASLGLAAWEGLRVAARRLGESATEAEACGALAGTTRDLERKAVWLRRQAQLLYGLGRSEAADDVLRAAVELDPSHEPALDALLRRLRSKNDHEGIIAVTAICDQQLDDEKRLVALAWERTRSLRALHKPALALREAQSLRVLEPERPETWQLLAELYLATDETERAASALSSLAQLEGANRRQRLLGGVGAADLYEVELKNDHAAYEVLHQLSEAKLGGLVVLERMTRAALRAELWPEASEALLQLVSERPSPAGKEAAARLCLAIARDALHDDNLSARACAELLRVVPTDAEAIDHLVAEMAGSPDARALAEVADAALRAELRRTPSPEGLARLVRLAEFRGATSARFAWVGLLAALGQVQEQTLSELDRDLPAHKATAPLSPEVLERLGPPDQPTARALRLLEPHAASLFAETGRGLEPASRDVADAVAHLGHQLQIAPLTVLVSAKQSARLRVIPGPQGVHVHVNESVEAPLSSADQLQLIREFVFTWRGQQLHNLATPEQAVALLAGARLLGLGGPSEASPATDDPEPVVSADAPGAGAALAPDAPHHAGAAPHAPRVAGAEAHEPDEEVPGALEMRDQLAQVLNRTQQGVLARTLRATGELASEIANVRQQTEAMADRVAAIVLGDVSLVLSGGFDRGARRPFAANALDSRTRALMEFVLSDEFAIERERAQEGHRGRE